MFGSVKRKSVMAACALALLGGVFAVPVAPAAAEWHRFHGGAVVAWGPGEVGLWRVGYWHHGWYGGRYGWWWGVGGAYYWYPQPIYPYPAVASEVYLVETPNLQVIPAQPVAPPASYYYCDNPAGYYPAIPVCNQPFRAVPVKPQN